MGILSGLESRVLQKSILSQTVVMKEFISRSAIYSHKKTQIVSSGRWKRSATTMKKSCFQLTPCSI